MIKSVLYVGLAIVAVVVALFSPITGAIACVEAYLLNPKGDSNAGLGISLPVLDVPCVHRRDCDQAAETGRQSRMGRRHHLADLDVVRMCLLSSFWALVNSEEAMDSASDMVKTMLVATAFIWAIRSESDLSTFITACLVGVLHAALLHTFGARLGFISSSLDVGEGVLIEGQSQVMVLFIPLLVMVLLRGSRAQQLLHSLLCHSR